MTSAWKLALAGGAALLAAGSAQSATPASAGQGAPAERGEEQLLTIAEAKTRYPGRLSQVVLRYLSIMETAVNKDKASASEADWAPLGALLDTGKFHRVGNFAEHMGWAEYSTMLARWAKANWWKGYIWRMSEVPAADGRNGLVYLEAQERSNKEGPVVEGGTHSALESISVYEIDGDDKIVGLHVYDHRPR